MGWAPHSFTLRQIQYVLAVAEHRSFRRAAEVCRVAQPSLSAQVAQIEDALGVRLFERDKTRVLVANGAEPILARMRRVIAESDELAEVAVRARDPLSGTIRIGVIPTVAPYLLPEVAPALRGAYPRLSIVWIEDKTRALVESLRAGAIDAALAALESELGDVEHARIGEDPFVLAMPRGHALGKRRRAALGDLASEKVLLLEDGHCFGDQARSLCRSVGAEESSLRATSLSTLAQMVAGGLGVTLLPSIAIAAESRGGGLAVRPLSPAPLRTLALVWRRRSPIEPALRAIAETISGGLARARSATRPI